MTRVGDMQSQPGKSDRPLAIDPRCVKAALGDPNDSCSISGMKIRDGAPDIRRRTPIVDKESVVARASDEKVRSRTPVQHIVAVDVADGDRILTRAGTDED